MRTTLYTFISIILLLTACSKWNVTEKEIKPSDPNPVDPKPVTSVGAVTLLNLKPTALGHLTATISFKVETPPAVSEYGVILTPDPGQIGAIQAGTAAPLRRAVTAALTGDGTVNFEAKDLIENSPYYAVAYAKDAAGKTAFSKDFVSFRTKFGPKNNNWRQLANLPTQRAYAFNPLFAINGKVYVGGAAQPASAEGYYYFKQLYEYDPETNLWAQKKDFPGTGRSEPTVAVLNGKAYILFGAAVGRGSYTADAWEYDPANDAWRQLANPPVTRAGGQGEYNKQAGALSFVYDNRVFTMFGRGTYNNDVNQTNIYNAVYALNPASNTWEVSFPLNDKGYDNSVIYGAARSGPFSFQYDKWVYFGGGLAAKYYNAVGSNLPYSRYFNSRQIWGYNVETRELKQIALLPTNFGDCSGDNDTGGRMQGFAFVVGSKAYITDCSSQVWVMDLASGNFTPQLSSALRHPSPTTGIGIGVGSKAFFGLRNADWWEFTPN
ncbi:hypothetical protein GCM10027341_47610 [Spirosoma knui]